MASWTRSCPCRPRGSWSAYFVIGRAPTWFDIYKWRIVGLVAGVAAALLLLFGFKGFWFARRRSDAADAADAEDGESQAEEPAEKPLLKVTCPSCGATSTNQQDTCS